MTYTVSSGTLNSSIPYHTSCGSKGYGAHASTSLTVPVVVQCAILYIVEIDCSVIYVTSVIRVFLPRDAMRKRGLCCGPVSVCPSDWLSVTLVYCNQTAEDIVKLLSRPGSPVILVFDPSADTQFQREPFQRERKIQGVGKFCDFRLKSQSVPETERDRPMVAMER